MNRQSRSERIARIERHFFKLWTLPEFDDPSKHSEIMEDMPDYAKYVESKLALVGLRRTSQYYESNSSISVTGAKAYLRPTYEEPILTSAQSYHLFRKYNFLKYRAKGKFLECRYAEAEKILLCAGEIRNQLTNCNLRLAVSVVNRHVEKLSDVETEDYFSEAYANILKAVDYFDFTRGFTFSTYASWVITKNIWKYIGDELKRISKYDGELVEEVIESRPEPDEVERRDLVQLVEKMLKILDKRERVILIRRSKNETLEVIGGALKITKERVRQLETRGKEKIRKYFPEPAI